MSRSLLLVALAALTTLTPPARAQIAPPPEVEETTDEATALTKLPELVTFRDATYPPEALEEGIEADVLLQLDIDATGAVTAVEVLEPVGAYGFDEAAVEAARGFVFTPAEAGGQPVAVRIQYRYAFTIEEQPAPTPEPPSDPVLRIRGQLRERGTRKPLVGQPVTVPATGASAITNENGDFELFDVPPGPVTVVVPPSQYEEAQVEVVVPEEGVAEVELFLKKDPYATFRTIIQAEEQVPQAVKRELSVAEIQKIPGVSGDALKAVQNLPGVARASFGSGQIVTRGSAPEDTIFRIDDMELPQLYHFGGVYSVFNTDLLDTLDYYPGGFSVKHGDGTAGLVDVTLKRPRDDRWGGAFDINVFHASGLASGPVWDGGSLSIAARRSYIDAILPAVLPDDASVSFSSAPAYYDYQVLLDTELSDRDTLRAFVYGSDDRLKLILKEPSEGSPAVRNDVRTAFLFHNIQTRWTHRFSRDVRLDSTVLIGTQTLSFDVGEAIDFKIYTGKIQLREDFTAELFDGFTLRGGLDAGLSAFAVEITAPQPPKEGEVGSPLGSTETVRADEDGVILRNGLYAEAIAQPIDELTLTGGVRVDVYAGAWEEVTFDPRVSVRWEVVDGTALKAGLGTYHRAPNPDEWSKSFGNPNLDAELAIQYSLGMEQRLWEGLTIDVQGFYKDLRDLVAPSTDPFAAEKLVNSGKGRIFGGELMLRQTVGGWFWGWVAYTVSRSERQDQDGQPYRLFDYDQTHVLTAVTSFVLPLEFQIGARFRYATGNPDTPVTRAVFDADVGTYARVAGEVNSSRIGDFHQLDIRLDKVWSFEDWILTTYVEVQNVYNRKNPEGVSYNYDYTESQPVSGLPIIPGFGIKGEF